MGAMQYFSEHPAAVIVTLAIIALLVYGMCMNQKKDGGGKGGSDSGGSGNA